MIRTHCARSILATFAVSIGLATSAQIRAAPIRPLAERPTKTQYHLDVEPLVTDVADLDIRRLTILFIDGQKVKLHIGEGGIDSRGVPGDLPGMRKLEVILILRLTKEGQPRRMMVRQLVKFGREYGSIWETTTEAGSQESLRGTVDIKARSGRFSVSKPLIVGKVLNQELTIVVEE